MRNAIWLIWVIFLNVISSQTLLICQNIGERGRKFGSAQSEIKRSLVITNGISYEIKIYNTNRFTYVI